MNYLGQERKDSQSSYQDCSQVRETAARERGRKKRSSSASGVPSHRHCSVCWAPIPLDAEPPVCSDEECEKTHDKRNASRKRLTIMLYLFPAIAILIALLTSI